jgi:hypothetical protein
MSLVLNLPSELETQLTAEAAQLGLPLAEYALRLIAAGRDSCPHIQTGAELLAYWQAEQLPGSRSDIQDTQVHARDLRGRAEARPRS